MVCLSILDTTLIPLKLKTAHQCFSRFLLFPDNFLCSLSPLYSIYISLCIIANIFLSMYALNLELEAIHLFQRSLLLIPNTQSSINQVKDHKIIIHQKKKTNWNLELNLLKVNSKEYLLYWWFDKATISNRSLCWVLLCADSFGLKIFPDNQ